MTANISQLTAHVGKKHTNDGHPQALKVKRERVHGRSFDCAGYRLFARKSPTGRWSNLGLVGIWRCVDTRTGLRWLAVALGTQAIGYPSPIRLRAQR